MYITTTMVLRDLTWSKCCTHFCYVNMYDGSLGFCQEGYYRTHPGFVPFFANLNDGSRRICGSFVFYPPAKKY